MSRTQLCPRTKIHIILFHLSPSPSTDSRRAWLNPKYLLHPPDRPPPFYLMITPQYPIFPLFETKNSAPLPPSTPSFLSFCLSPYRANFIVFWRKW